MDTATFTFEYTIDGDTYSVLIQGDHMDIHDKTTGHHITGMRAPLDLTRSGLYPTVVKAVTRPDITRCPSCYAVSDLAQLFVHGTPIRAAECRDCGLIFALEGTK